MKSVTTDLEKAFFKYIIINKRLINEVEPHFFVNPIIRSVYEPIHSFMTKHPTSDKLTPQQIWSLVQMSGSDVKADELKVLLQVDLKGYDIVNFLSPNLDAWILKNRFVATSEDSVNIYRQIESAPLDRDIIVGLGNTLIERVSRNINLSMNDETNLGSNFLNPESHIQDFSTAKVQTGYPTIDSVLGGGLDVSTLNVLMGMTNSGKSLWMQNMAVRAADLGYDVVYFTLEMSEAKCIKRMGAMRLKIPIKDYDRVSTDTTYIQSKIDELKDRLSNKKAAKPIFDILEGDRKIGDINVKFFAAGTATIYDLANHLELLKTRVSFKPRIIFVDYITIMASIKALNIESNLYQKGKHLAEGLRAIAAKYECPLVTAVQVTKDAWNATNITLDKIPESKAIAETADTFWAIIRNEQMKRENRYNLSLLKQRDGDFSRSFIEFIMDPTYLTIGNDNFIDQLG